MSLTIKICGLRHETSLDAALHAGADMVGFVVFPPSPRHIDPRAAGALARRARGRAKVVALTVDADDSTLADVVEVLAPDILQLHGTETPDRVAAVRARFDRPVIRAIALRGVEDLAHAAEFEDVADWLLFDAQAPKTATRPGGNGVPFDWTVLESLSTRRPWLLAGGLTPANVATALSITTAPGIDVSSGVESAPGEKDPAAIIRFIDAARGAAAGVQPGRALPLVAP